MRDSNCQVVKRKGDTVGFQRRVCGLDLTPALLPDLPPRERTVAGDTNFARKIFFLYSPWHASSGKSFRRLTSGPRLGSSLWLRVCHAADTARPIPVLCGESVLPHRFIRLGNALRETVPDTFHRFSARSQPRNRIVPYATLSKMLGAWGPGTHCCSSYRLVDGNQHR